jgi:DNA-binding response OmpR family regulator
MSNILLVEDDVNLGFIIQDQLESFKYNVIRCVSAKEALVTLGSVVIDLCLLDIMMPVKGGFDLASDIKKLFPEMPIVFLTAKHGIEDKIKGLELGADDYITKPFDIRELNLRIRNILTRIHPNEAESILNFRIGKFVFNTELNELVFGAGNRQHLTKKESSLLKILVENKNQLVTRESLAQLVWGEDSYFVSRTMDVYIAKLRKYLISDPSVQITNVHGVGFKFEILTELKEYGKKG